MESKLEIATFGGGCFWCTEAVFSELRGVVSVDVGYSGGSTANPSYEQVCTGRTGHAEVVQVGFDPAKISYRDLLAVFFATHDPTSLNRQGADVGPQYRSVIFYHNADQKREAQELINELNASYLMTAPVVTELCVAQKFYPAESNHRKYYQNNSAAPYCQFVINPKLNVVRERYAKLLKSQEVPLT